MPKIQFSNQIGQAELKEEVAQLKEKLAELFFALAEPEGEEPEGKERYFYIPDSEEDIYSAVTELSGELMEAISSSVVFYGSWRGEKIPLNFEQPQGSNANCFSLTCSSNFLLKTNQDWESCDPWSDDHITKGTRGW